jgi:antitoxin MazE
MSEVVLDIKHWGNSLGVRLPTTIARAARLHADQRVHISVEGDRVVISPVTDAPLSLEQRLARYNAQQHGGEVMATGRLGAEKW